MVFFALKIWVRTPTNQGNMGFHGSVCVFSLEIMPAFKRKTNGGNKKVSTRLATLWWEGEALCEFCPPRIPMEIAWMSECCKKNLVCGLWGRLHIKYTWQQLSIDVSQTMLIWCMSVILVSLTIVGYMTSPWYFLGCFLMEETHDKNFMGSPSHEKMLFFSLWNKGVTKHTRPLSRWWFQIFLFSPLPGEMIQFD